METFNIAQFLARSRTPARPGTCAVYPGDVLVVDEATQVSTEDALRITQIARRCGAMVIAHVRARAQLGSVNAGGIFPPDRRPARVLPAHRGPPVHQCMGAKGLAEAARGRCDRAGRVSQAAARSTRGGDRVFDDAINLLNGFLDGREALLMATSNETACRLSTWSASAWPSSAASARLRSRCRTVSRQAAGDLIRARLNSHMRHGRTDAGQPQRGPRGERRRQRL